MGSVKPETYRDRCIKTAFKIQAARFSMVKDFMRGYPIGQKLKRDRDSDKFKYAVVRSHNRKTAGVTLWYPQEQTDMDLDMHTVALRYDAIKVFPWKDPEPIDIDALTDGSGR